MYSNDELLTILKEVLAAMEVKQASFFRIRAYQNVIAAIEDLTISVYDLWKQNRLAEVSGIGGTLTQHLENLFTKGKVKDFDDVKDGLPEGMFALLGLRGIGAKKAFKLATVFQLEEREGALEHLKRAAENGKIREIEGFGEKSEKVILETLNEQRLNKNSKERMLLNKASQVATRITEYLLLCEDVVSVEVLGSLRRREPTVGDLDIAVATTNPKAVVAHFIAFPEVAVITAKGESRAAVVLSNDVQVDIRVCTTEALGAMTQYFTGSKSHNIALRNYALDKGLSLSEYGIKKADKLHEFKDETEFYNFIGLDYIPPELRQGKDEVLLASKHTLPVLVTLADIKGDLHMHTTDSDGEESLAVMVESALKKGYEYIAITDHNPSIKTHGSFNLLSIIETKRRAIEHINSSFGDVRVLYGYEIDILKSGELALPNSILAKLDFAIASLHTALDDSREQVTQRMLNAIRNPYIKFIGHPSGRLLTKRPPCDLDWEQILKAVKEEGKILEINAHPQRLDLAEDLVYEARKMGIKFIINTDAHSLSDLENMHYGVDVAKRGWCTKDDILNTKPSAQFLTEFGIL
jgi:DNA polymerase (family 10)